MADKPTFHCTVAVPNRELFNGEVYYASVPSVEGQYGVLPGHELILSLNQAGGLCSLHLNEDGSEKVEILLYNGAAEFIDNKLTILGHLGKLTSRVKLDEMTERVAAQEKLVEDTKPPEDATEGEKITHSVEVERLDWYKLQVEWAKKNGK
jgi:F-type H+-transporting ATPase subunit epsilon